MITNQILANKRRASVNLAGKNMASQNPGNREDSAMSTGVTLGNATFERQSNGSVRIKDIFDYNFDPSLNLEFAWRDAKDGDLSSVAIQLIEAFQQ
jgi:hypothetical protein